jgi:hypothetical protein
MTCIEEAKQELRAKARPEIKAYPDNFDDYDTIFVGYPNWWGTMPMCMFTLLEKYDLTGRLLSRSAPTKAAVWAAVSVT